MRVRRRTQLAGFALSALLAAPSALAGHGDRIRHGGQHGSGAAVIIYYGTGSLSHADTRQRWYDRHRGYRHGYRDGYRDGFRDGHYGGQHWRPGHVRPPSVYYRSPSARVDMPR